MANQTSQACSVALTDPAYVLTAQGMAMIAYTTNPNAIKPEYRFRVLKFQARVKAMVEIQGWLTGRRPHASAVMDAVVNFSRLAAAMQRGDGAATMAALFEGGARA